MSFVRVQQFIGMIGGLPYEHNIVLVGTVDDWCLVLDVRFPNSVPKVIAQEEWALMPDARMENQDGG